MFITPTPSSLDLFIQTGPSPLTNAWLININDDIELPNTLIRVTRENLTTDATIDLRTSSDSLSIVGHDAEWNRVVGLGLQDIVSICELKYIDV